nr:phage tail tape measure C-terminal domain-containing protein [Candidatus Thermoplasmatota archaeon]
QIQDARHELEELEAASIRIKEEGAGAGLDIIGFNVSDTAIEQARQKLAELEAEKQRQDEAEKQRMEASLRRHRDEAEAKRQQTEAMIKAMDAKAAADEAEAQAQKEKNKLLVEEEKKREEIYQWSVQGWIAEDEWRRASIEGAKESIAALNEQKDVVKEIVDEGKSQFEELKQVIDGWGKDSAAAIADFAMSGETSFRDMIDSMIRDLLRMMVYQNITKPLFGFVGGLFANAHGNAFQNGNVIPFAKGGIVSRPTIFPMAQGAGLMGEAGPEAILPLTRIGGDLGVKADVGPSPDPQPMHVGEGRGIRIVNVLDKSIINDWARSPQGEKIIMNYIYKSGYGGQNNGL